MRKLRSLLVDGVLFLLPVAVVVMMVRGARKILRPVVEPVAALFPVHKIAGVTVVEIGLLIALVLVAVLAGLFARSPWGERCGQWLEQLVMRHIPGFGLLRSASGEWGGSGERDVFVALVNFDDNSVIGFVVETHADGRYTVFVPSAPTPAAGTVYVMEAHRVQRLDAPITQAIKSVVQLGAGTRALLEKPATALGAGAR